jgi:uncharacterized membrane protein
MKFILLLKWTLLVWLNAAGSFQFSAREFPQIIDRAEIVSSGIVKIVIGKVAFLSAYIITLTEGFILSLFVIAITVIINYLMTIFFTQEQMQ